MSETPSPFEPAVVDVAAVEVVDTPAEDGTPTFEPSYTPSRAFFRTDETTLLPVAVRTEKANYFVTIDHPVVAGLGVMSQVDRLQANTELLKAQNMNFWEDLPEIPESKVNETVQLRDDFKPMPKEDWVRLIKLYSAFCEKSPSAREQELEVGALLVVERETNQIRVIIPEQLVTKTSVDWSIVGKNLGQNKKMYFLDGTPISYTKLKSDYDNLGISHSHNTMGTFPSGTDNEYEVRHKGENCATGVHILVGSFSGFKDWKTAEPSYQIYPSISHAGKRTKLEDCMDQLRESYDEEDWVAYNFADVVLQAIRKPVYHPPTYTRTYTPPKVTTRPGFPQANQRFYTSPPVDRTGVTTGKAAKPDYSGKPAPGNSPAANIYNLKRERAGLDHIYYALEAKESSHGGASDIVRNAAYDLLDKTLEFLYFVCEDDAQTIAENVGEYFSAELGEYITLNSESQLLSSDPDSFGLDGDEEDLKDEAPDDDEIEALQRDLLYDVAPGQDVTDPFYAGDV